MKTILITGATGLIGSHLIDKLLDKDSFNIRILTRDIAKARRRFQLPIQFFHWDIDNKKIDVKAVKNVDIIVHLAGESVAGYWTSDKKEKILNSRVDSTNLLLDSLKQFPKQKTKFIQASAIGIYGDCGSDLIDENTPHSSGFLADVCKKWEEVLLDQDSISLEKYIVRIGIVLSTQGGALQKMLTPFKLNLGGSLGSGNQFMSWIHIDDLVSVFLFLIEKSPSETIFNGVALNPVTNRQFTKTLNQVLGKLTFLPVPKKLIKLVLGEMSQIVLSSQRIEPKSLIKNQFQFKYSELSSALKNLLRYQVKGEELLIEKQWIDRPIDETFNFFKDPKNLEKITPEYLNFKVLNMNTKQIQKGSLIRYKLKLHGIPFKWKTLISKFEENQIFIDQQQKGPYKKWVHTHTFSNINNGTLIKDHVVYKLPLGGFGRAIAGKYVRNDVKKIFSYRKDVIRDNFLKE